MTDILLRDVDDELGKALRIQAIKHGRTLEAEIKSILESTVAKKQLSFSEVLKAIPKIDEDIDELFKRSDSPTRSVDF